MRRLAGNRLVAGFVTVQVIDRLPHRKLMIGADVVRAVAVGALALLTRRGELSLAAIYIVTAVTAFAGAFFTPARLAILPAVVERAQLMQANGLIASAVQLVQTGGWALGATLVALIGAPAAILVNASNRVVRDVTIMDGLETFANTIWTSPLMLAFTIQVLLVGQEWWGYQSAAYFVGTVIGGVVAAFAASWLSRWGGWTIALSSGIFALLTVWYAFAGSAPLAVVLCVAFGPVYQVRDVVQSSMLQATLDPRAIGRAFATREMLLMGLFGPALAAMSLLADVAGPRFAFLAGGGLYGVVTIFAALSVPIRTYKLAPSAA